MNLSIPKEIIRVKNYQLALVANGIVTSDIEVPSVDMSVVRE